VGGGGGWLGGGCGGGGVGGGGVGRKDGLVVGGTSWVVGGRDWTVGGGLWWGGGGVGVWVFVVVGRRLALGVVQGRGCLGWAGGEGGRRGNTKKSHNQEKRKRIN